MTKSNLDEVEQAIRQLPAVHAARVLLNEETGTIDKVHVMASPTRSPKKIVRDIETVFLLKFDQRLDYRKISLVHGTLEDFEPFMRSRLRLTAVEKRDQPGGYRIMIGLADDSDSYLGVAEGPASAELPTLASLATLDALHSAVPGVMIEHTATKTIPVDDDTVLLIALTIQDDNGGTTLLGSAYAKGDSLSAAARATLDAVNRRLFSA